MKKIPSLFARNYEGDRKVINQIVPGSEWVINGEGKATRKYDGTAVMIKDNVLYKRYDAKGGKTPPEGFIAAQDPDPISGHWPGWLEANRADKGDKWIWEAYDNFINDFGLISDGTYEACGPKINGNNEKLDKHLLFVHGLTMIIDKLRDYESIKNYLRDLEIEGIVWHHPDGRMVKIKKKDFNYNLQDK